MFIERDFSRRQATDFISNVKPKLNDKLVAEEVYKDKMLIGWIIVKLIK